MKFTKMDPSCAVGFYCRTREDFDYFCNSISEVQTFMIFLEIILGAINMVKIFSEIKQNW